MAEPLREFISCTHRNFMRIIGSRVSTATNRHTHTHRQTLLKKTIPPCYAITVWVINIAVTWWMFCVGVAGELCAWHSAWLLHRSSGVKFVLAASTAAQYKVQVVLKSDISTTKTEPSRLLGMAYGHIWRSRPTGLIINRLVMALSAITSYCCFSCLIAGTVSYKCTFQNHFNILSKFFFQFTVTYYTLLLGYNICSTEASFIKERSWNFQEQPLTT